MIVQLPHLEVNITTACQLRCVGCNHFIPMQRPAFVDPRQIERDLRVFTQVAHSARFAVIGGEPLLHKRIVEILDVVRDSGITDWIEVWTNGIRAPEMGADFWRRIDELVVTRYPGKLSDQDVETMQLQCRAHGVTFTLRNGPEWFVALLYRRTATPAEAAAMYRGCWYKTYTHVLDNGYFYRCCVAPFLPKLILGKDEGADGLSLQGISIDKLRAYLAQAETPASCYRCAGHAGPRIQWREARRETWLEESMI